MYTNLQFRLNHFSTLIGTDVYHFLGATLREAISQCVRHHNFNARTGCGVADFINDDDDMHVPVADNYLQDKSIKYRLSQDPIVDTRGRNLIDLCIESQLRILNGRFFGDSQGMYTSYNYNGNSVVDYMLASENLLSQVLYFNVGLNIPRLSDHSKICCKIVANFLPNPNVEKLQPFSAVYKWSSISAGDFTGAFSSNPVKCKINDLENSKDGHSVDQLFTKLNDVIITAADIEDITRVVISYEIYQTSLRRV